MSTVTHANLEDEETHREWLAGNEPGWAVVCDCGRTVEHFRGMGDVSCSCGREWNAFGQELRGDWRGNPSLYDDDIDDMEGYERQQLGKEF